MRRRDYVYLVIAGIGIFFGVYSIVIERRPDLFGVALIILGLTVTGLILRKSW